MSPSLNTIRSWAGSQHRAFEELCFQLFAEDVPAGQTAIRTGNPDGGVEWYSESPDGTSQGWQAKFIDDFDVLLGEMKGSLKRVVAERPTLTDLTFIIKTNLSAGTAKGKRSSQRQRFTDAQVRWKTDLPGADRVAVHLLQESDVLARLTEQRHRARGWFWWEQVAFSDEWLADYQSQQVTAAGAKYRPDLQVDLPIQDDLRALRFADCTLAVLGRLELRIRQAAAAVDFSERTDAPDRLNDLYGRVRESLAAADGLLARGLSTPRNAASAIQGIDSAVAAAADAIIEAQNAEFDLHRAWEDRGPDDAERGSAPPSSARSFRTRELMDALQDLDAWLHRGAGSALGAQRYFLEGAAGSGKTHLLLDAVNEGVLDGCPGLFVPSAALSGDLWTSICDHLGLPGIGREALLTAMDSAGEAASLSGRRFVLAIDALNEARESDFWLVRLPLVRAALAQRPHIALAVSCRDTYVEVIDPQRAERKHFVTRTHPGFAGFEIEAALRYFTHFGLELPRIPLLVPEFTLPLFLRMYCESLAGDPRLAPTGHEGRVAIFERYLDAKVAAVAGRLDNARSNHERDQTKRQVAAALNAVIDEMASCGVEELPIDDVERVMGEATSAFNPAAVLGALNDEGVMSIETLYLGNGVTGMGVRVLFQAFSDYLLLRRRLDASPDVTVDRALHDWLRTSCSSGVLEAATVVFPERYEIELLDLLGIDRIWVNDLDWADQSDEDRHTEARQRTMFKRLVLGLPYRSSSAVTQRTIDLLNSALQEHAIDSRELFRTVFTLAPQPDNFLNAERLDSNLRAMSMPKRDAWFGAAVLDEIWDPDTPTVRLARWAASGPYPSYDPHVIELACVPLLWLMSTPNRAMRDWVTKALTQLLRGHLEVMAKLVERFIDVNDPYVVQRVLAVAYGALLRSDPADGDGQATLAGTVAGVVFTPPVPADELLLDAARGIVRWAVGRDLLPETEWDRAMGPYGLAAPAHPPTEERLEATYGYQADTPEAEEYRSIYHSVLSLGDFGRYIVQPGVHHFLRYRKGDPRPPKETWEGNTRPLPSRWKRFVASLSAEQREAFADELDHQPAYPTRSRWRYRLDGESMRDDLSKEQWGLYDASWRRRQPVRIEKYPADRAQRWIFTRVIGLGWTAKLFEKQDRQISHRSSGRNEKNVERWGKKYQWIAFHELLARVADNYQWNDQYDEQPFYTGLHQIGSNREIDPTLPPLDYTARFGDEPDRSARTWPSPPIELAVPQFDLDSYKGDIAALLADVANEPTLESTMLITDTSGEDWLVLSAILTDEQSDSLTRWTGLNQQVELDTWLAPADDAAAFAEYIVNDASRISDLIDSHGHVDCCYAFEAGGNGPPCGHRHDHLGSKVIFEDLPFSFVASTERYLWEGNIRDRSLTESVYFAAPSSFLRLLGSLRMSADGPSWRDDTGAVQVAFVDPIEDQARLVVRATWLSRVLAANDLCLVAALFLRRVFMAAERTHDYPSKEIDTIGLVDPDLKVSTVGVRSPFSDDG